MNSSEGGVGRSSPDPRRADAPKPERSYLRNILLVLVGLGACLVIALWLLREPAAETGAAPAAATALRRCARAMRAPPGRFAS